MGIGMPSSQVSYNLSISLFSLLEFRVPDCTNKQEFLFYERLQENYCFVLLTSRAPPKISYNRPDMRQRALFVTSRAAWRWNKMLLASIRVAPRRTFCCLSSVHPE